MKKHRLTLEQAIIMLENVLRYHAADDDATEASGKILGALCRHTIYVEEPLLEKLLYYCNLAEEESGQMSQLVDKTFKGLAYAIFRGKHKYDTKYSRITKVEFPQKGDEDDNG